MSQVTDEQQRQLVSELVAAVKRFAPDWTSHSSSDPGVTLLLQWPASHRCQPPGGTGLLSKNDEAAQPLPLWHRHRQGTARHAGFEFVNEKRICH